MTVRLRPPYALLGALCAGLALANAARPGVAAAAAAATGALLAAAALPERARLPAFGVVLVLAGWWWGGARLDALDGSALEARVGEAARATVVVTGPARRGTFSLRVPADARRFGRLAVDEPVQLVLPLGRAPPQGAVLELVGTLRSPRTADGDFDERAWLRRQGVAVVVAAERWRVVGRRGGLGGLADRLRRHLVETIAPGLTGERRAVLAGIVLGEDEGLSAPLRDAFRASGLYHLLAVSGQNVAFIAGGVIVAAWLLTVPRLVAELGVLAAIGAYVLAVGWQPSVVRAGVAGALASLAWLVARPRDRWYFLLAGAAVLLAWNPYSLLEPGFQLSFTAVAAIFVVVPRVRRTFEGYPVPPALADVVSISAACGVATAPVLWLHFGSVPAYSVPANALAAPVVAPLLGIGLVCAAAEPLAPGLAEALAWGNGWLAAYLAGCARLVASLPGAEITSGGVLLALAAFAVAAAAVARAAPYRRRPLAAALVAVAVLVGGWRVVPPPAPDPPRGLRLTFLDVGQGDATLVETPAGALLVDAGPPEADVAGQLRRRGIRRLALVVLTHPSRDNIGGGAEVVRRLGVEALMHAALPFDDPFGAPALAEAHRRGVRVLVARAGATYAFGDVRVAVLWPPDGARRSDEPNDHATVLLLTLGRTSALLPADAESNVLARLRLPRVDVLKVAHHGSADPGLEDLLRRIRPALAVVSVGARNEYGHPAPSTVSALRGVPLYRTDEDGPVVVETDGAALVVRTER